jgi:hypothetical protein
MLDKGKMKEIGGEVKALKKSLEKLKKQLDKLNSKGGNKSEESEVEEKEIVDEVNVDLDENEEMEYEGMEKDEERFDADGTPNEEGMYDAEGNRVSFADIDKAMYDGEAEYMNESFLHMQKLAGVITEAQYKAKRKALNEAEDFKVGETYTASMPTDSTGNKRMDIKVKFLGKNKMNGHDNFVVTPIQDVDYKNNESGQMNRFEKGKQYNTEAEFIK